MYKLTKLLVAVSRSWWLCALALVLNITSFWVLFRLEDRFEALTGVPVFDTQNDLTVETLVQQLPLYTGSAYAAYLRFAAFDWLFPFVGALFLALVWTLLLRLNSGRIAQILLRWNLPLLPFLATLFDWAENITLLLVTGANTQPGPFLLSAAVVCKRLKLASLQVISALSLLLTALLIAQIVADRWRKSAQSTKSA